MARERPFFGPAVRPDRSLRYTSVSALQTFDAEGTDGGCERKWFGPKILRWEEPESKSQQVGTEKHAEIENYLLTGEQTLSDITRAGRHLLPARGPDLFVEQAFGCAVEKEHIVRALQTERQPFKIESMRRRLAWLEEQLRLPGGESPLLADGLPLVGFIDLRHQRGEFVDEAGVVRREATHLGLTCEVIDHKTTSDIARWAKSGDDLLGTLQMQGYAVRVGDVIPGLQTVRVSHIYYQTARAKAARKSTATMSLVEARQRWARVDGLVKKMRLVARAERIEDVDANYASCEKFGGCPHQARCPRANMTIHDLFRKDTGDSDAMQGFFADLAVAADASGSAPPSSVVTGFFADAAAASAAPVAQASPSPPPVPSVSTPSTEGAVSAARSAFAAGGILASLAVVGKEYRLVLSSAVPPVVVTYLGGLVFAGADGVRRVLLVDDVVIPVDVPPSIPAGVAAVMPPDAPVPALADVAAALPLSVRQEIADPEIRERADLVAASHAARAASAPATEKQKTEGRCLGGGQLVDAAQVKRGARFTCSTCGRSDLTAKVADGKATLQGHMSKPTPTSPPGVPQLPPGVPSLPPGVPSLPPGVPSLPAGVPALPAGVPALPAGVPALPAGVPALPAGVPLSPAPPPANTAALLEEVARARLAIAQAVASLNAVESLLR